MAEETANPAQTTGATTEGESDGQTVSAGALPEPAPGPDADTPGATASGSGPASAAAPAEPAKRPYPAPAEVPTQPAARGIRFDFNDGCRVAVPEGKEPWRTRLSIDPTKRIRDPLPHHRLARLQRLLERPAPPLRPQGLPVVPAARQYAAAVRMHAVGHRRAGVADDPTHPRLRGIRLQDLTDCRRRRIGR